MQFDVSQPIAFLRARRDQIDQAIAALEALGVPPAIAAPPARKADPARGGARQKPAKAAKAPKVSAKPSTESAPRGDDALPIARKGRVPRKGAQQEYCATHEETAAKVAVLKAAGLRRAGPMERLSPGLFDVRPSRDDDGTSVVLWREVAGE
jgi:hypothetical protein